MSASFTLHMSRSRALAVVVCFVAAGLLLFVAGTVSGLLLASTGGGAPSARAQMPVAEVLAVPGKKLTAAAPANTTAETAGGITLEPVAANVPTLTAVPPAPPAAAAMPSSTAASGGLKTAAAASAAMSAGASAGATPPPAAGPTATAAKEPAASGTGSEAAQASAQSSYAIPLAIKVCSFSARASAEALIAALAAKGYHASLGRSAGANGRTWYVVKLGPYTEWNTASDVAARIAIAENVRPVIGPMQ